MNTRTFILPASVLAITGALAIGMPATAGAASTPASTAAPGPPGYRVAFGPIPTVPNGVQARSTVNCPKGTVPLGGGVFVDAGGLSAGVSSSFPTKTGWTAVFNNASGSDASFEVAVTCAKKPAHYSIVASKPVRNPSGRRTTVGATCPTSARPLSGGSQSTGGLFVNLGASRPFNNGWRVAEDDDTANIAAGGATATPTVKAFTVCGSVAGYRLVTQTPSTLPANGQTTLSATCPTGSVVLGGGASVNTPSIGVSFNSTAPIDPLAAIVGQRSSAEPFAWDTTVNDNTDTDASGAPFAICAGR